jgi:hypothetical protein
MHPNIQKTHGKEGVNKQQLFEPNLRKICGRGIDVCLQPLEHHIHFTSLTNENSVGVLSKQKKGEIPAECMLLPHHP